MKRSKEIGHENAIKTLFYPRIRPRLSATLLCAVLGAIQLITVGMTSTYFAAFALGGGAVRGVRKESIRALSASHFAPSVGN